MAKKENPFQTIANSIPKKTSKVVDVKKGHCKKCEKDYELHIFESGYEFKLGCDCDAIAEAKRRKAVAEKNIQSSKVNRIFNQSIINPKIKQARFETYQTDNDKLQRAFKIAMRYVEVFDVDVPRSLYFHGTFGTGKTHLAYSIAHGVKSKGYTVLFMNIPQLITMIKNTYNKNASTSEFEMMQLIADVDLMVFDDLGVNMNDFAMAKLFEMIDSRVGKNNIFTTNMTANEIGQSKDWQRLFSRIAEDATLVEMNGDDYRLRGLKND